MLSCTFHEHHGSHQHMMIGIHIWCGCDVVWQSWILTHTGKIDGSWRGAKKAVPVSSKNGGKRNVRLLRCLRRYQWRWKAQARTWVNTLQRRSLHPEREKSYRCPFSSQNAVRRVVQKTGEHFISSNFHVRSYALVVARCSFWQILAAGFASAGMLQHCGPY